MHHYRQGSTENDVISIYNNVSREQTHFLSMDIVMCIWPNFFSTSIKYFSLAASLLMVSTTSFAQLYETQGQAIVEDNNIDMARTKAMENALQKALLVAGASVSSVQQVVNGLMTQNEISIRASGSVNAIELIDETYADNLVTVTIRADIFPQEKQCFSADFRKTLLMTRSKLLHREHASIGDIYDLDQSVIKVLANKLKSKSQYINAKLFNKVHTQFSRLNQSINIEGIKTLSTSLADRTNSHYIFYSEILDLSFNRAATNNWQFWQSDIFDRQFTIAIYIYNGTNGELIFEKQYKNTAPWQFNKREAIDVNSQIFWQSDYGQMVDRTLHTLVSDIDKNMVCQPTQARIVKVAGNKITFNLGQQHGVKVGDEFTLLHKNNFTSDAGIYYPSYKVSPYKVKVTSVSIQSAKAVTINSGLLGNIQINDLAVRY